MRLPAAKRYATLHKAGPPPLHKSASQAHNSILPDLLSLQQGSAKSRTLTGGGEADRIRILEPRSSSLSLEFGLLCERERLNFLIQVASRLPLEGN